MVLSIFEFCRKRNLNHGFNKSAFDEFFNTFTVIFNKLENATALLVK